ncbi:unnamed protein product [Adineta steineri]|uniref:Uncharacterized protein n=1 Tax=Adineta steineri TaxID=433720 RepID=A0A814X6T0_9BILA|nr:unnamed protein product [Adineta steineri]CAF1210131.1 unnamed protein product [Adineta steineri]
MLIYVFVLLLPITILDSINPLATTRSYVIKRDFFRGAKANEFTILDPSKKQPQYRIESRYGLLQNAELVVYPSKQPIAKLQQKFKLLLYSGIISILDQNSNQWINGTIQEDFRGTYIIEWNGQRVNVKSIAIDSDFTETILDKVLKIKFEFHSKCWISS